MAPLTTNRKSPSVRKVIGRVRMNTKGRTTAFVTPRRKAASQSDRPVSKLTPVRAWSAIHRPKAVTKTRATKLDIVSVLTVLSVSQFQKCGL